MDENTDLIWYAVYGSNLSHERFMYYINGGTPPGSAREYHACEDTTPPRAVLSYEMNYELVFGKNSGAWQNGGVAFVNNIENTQARTLAKLYLISKAQFNHVAKWETSSPGVIDVNFEQATEVGHTIFKQQSWYGMVLYLGEVEGYPAYTLTKETEIDTYTKPSPQYLTQIVNGLRESHGLSGNEIYDYLKTKKGIIGNYKDYELFDIAAGLLDPKRDQTKKLFSDYAREFDCMPEGEEKARMKLAMDELMRRYYGGFTFDYLA